MKRKTETLSKAAIQPNRSTTSLSRHIYKRVSINPAAQTRKATTPLARDLKVTQKPR